MFRQTLLLTIKLHLLFIEPKVEIQRKFCSFVNGNNILTSIKNYQMYAMYHIEQMVTKIILTDLSIKLTRLIHKNKTYEQHFNFNFNFFYFVHFFTIQL
jgi:DNA polymerase-3 subunit delta'